MADESRLIAKLKGGDLEAMAGLVRQHTGDLYRACLGLGMTSFEADDITQSVWATFFDVVVRFEGRSTLRTFLFGILYNKASEHRRQMGRAEPTYDIESIMDKCFEENGHWIEGHAPLAPDLFLERAHERSIIEKCLEALPFIQKMAFVLKEVEDWASDEICSSLEVTVNHLGVLLYRARNQLRLCIERKV